jgi:hypothetical protein
VRRGPAVPPEIDRFGVRFQRVAVSTGGIPRSSVRYRFHAGRTGTGEHGPDAGIGEDRVEGRHDW